MRWYHQEDSTPPIITAAAQIESKHEVAATPRLPGLCVIFEIGIAIRHMEEVYHTVPLIEKLPCFLANPKCIALEGVPGLCFTRGGYGAPAAVDTLEVLSALGVHTIVVAGMCGGFAPRVNVGDLLIPGSVHSEEGTSRHYTDRADVAYPDADLHGAAVRFFTDGHTLHTGTAVTTDALYRQTYYKEERWRQAGYMGVDMESSALLTVAACKSMRAVSLLIVSDKHPLSRQETGWHWGDGDFSCQKRAFIEDVVAFARTLV